MKTMLFLGGALVVGAYFMGVFDPSYSRVVDRSPAQVARALEDLDIREQPGSPGTDPAVSGGTLPSFRHERTADGMMWTVMSGKEVAVRMIAELQPIDEGTRTKVTAHVERGEAPDDFVSPGLRSKGTALALFSMALESELNELTLPKGDPERCRELVAKFEQRAPSPDMMHQDGMKDAMGDTASAILQISAMENELRRNGCDVSGKGGFRPVENRMRP